MDGVRACGSDKSLVRNALACEAVTVGQTAVDRPVLSCRGDCHIHVGSCVLTGLSVALSAHSRDDSCLGDHCCCHQKDKVWNCDDTTSRPGLQWFREQR